MIDWNFIVHIDTKLGDTLQKIEKNTKGFVVCIDNENICRGVITDGDVRRYVLSNSIVDLSSVDTTDVMNQSFCSRTLDSKPSPGSLSRFQFLPVVDQNGRLIKIDMLDKVFSIAGRDIGSQHKPFVIGEIGNNHNGDLSTAKKLIDELKFAGADCAKFQMRDMASLYSTAKDDLSDDVSTQYTKDLLRKFQLNDSKMLELFDYTRQIGLIPLCTPWDERSLEILYNIDMPALKIASADLTNEPLINAAVKTNLPLICSTGMSDEVEIKGLISKLDSFGACYAILHCNSTYHYAFLTRKFKIYQFT